MKFVERVAQDHITLERFADYWNKDAIHLDRVTYQLIPDSSVRLANLQAGSVDVVEYIVPTDTDAVKRNPRLRLVIYDGLGYQGITYNLGNGPQSKTAAGPERAGAAGVRHVDRPRGADAGRLQRDVSRPPRRPCRRKARSTTPPSSP